MGNFEFLKLIRLLDDGVVSLFLLVLESGFFLAIFGFREERERCVGKRFLVREFRVLFRIERKIVVVIWG